MVNARLAILPVGLWLLLGSAAAQILTIEQQYSVPEWVTRAMAGSGVDKTYVFEAWLNPFCHRGDFDGDGVTDFAVLVKELSSGKRGIAFIHRRDSRIFVVGAGRDLPNGGDNWSWMDAWIVFDKGKVGQGATDERPPVLKGDALLVFKTEAASAIVWWDGRRYRWYQQGD